MATETVKEPGERMIGAVKEYFARNTAPLEARIKALEERPAIRYLGVWDEGEYRLGAFVTHNGSIWHCNRTTRDRPGTSDAWTLAVKSGRDAR